MSPTIDSEFLDIRKQTRELIARLKAFDDEIPAWEKRPPTTGTHRSSPNMTRNQAISRMRSSLMGFRDEVNSILDRFLDRVAALEQHDTTGGNIGIEGAKKEFSSGENGDRRDEGNANGSGDTSDAREESNNKTNEARNAERVSNMDEPQERNESGNLRGDDTQADNSDARSPDAHGSDSHDLDANDVKEDADAGLPTANTDISVTDADLQTANADVIMTDADLPAAIAETSMIDAGLSTANLISTTAADQPTVNTGIPITDADVATTDTNVHVTTVDITTEASALQIADDVNDKHELTKSQDPDPGIRWQPSNPCNITKDPETVIVPGSEVEGSDIVDLTSTKEDDVRRPTMLLSRLNLPEPVQDTDAEISNLIQACMDANVTPTWFKCENLVHVREKLRQFEPGKQLKDDLLRELLQICAFPYGFYVAESLQVEISMPDFHRICKTISDAGDDVQGITMPICVDIQGQSRPSRKKNHWIIGVLDYHQHKFTTFGFELAIAKRWASEIEKALRHLGREERDLQLSTHSLPVNTDGASCGLCCCQALEYHLGNFPKHKQHDGLRAHYLRKYLRAYCMSRFSSEQPHDTITRIPFESSDGEHDTSGSNMMDQDPFDPQFTNIIPFTTALAGCSSGLEYARRVRILQLIMQCSMEEFHQLLLSNNAQDLSDNMSDQSSPVRSPGSPEAILHLYDELDQTPKDFFIPSLIQRLRLIEIFLSLNRQIAATENQMARDRKIRKRQSASGEPVQRQTDSGKRAETRVFDKLYDARPNPKTSRRHFSYQMRSYRDRGRILYHLISNLGIGILLALPSTTVHQSHIKLRSSKIGTANNVIEPSEYDSMELHDANYFIQWLPFFHKDQMRSWDLAWSSPLFTVNSFWTMTVAGITRYLKDVYPVRPSPLTGISRPLPPRETRSRATLRLKR